jgi:hypothetical protein
VDAASIEVSRRLRHVKTDRLDGDRLLAKLIRSAPREQLMKHLGLFEKDNRQQPPGAVVHPPGVRIEFTPILKTRKG